MAVLIKKVSSKKELKQFAEYPNTLYKGNPFYIPTLASDDVNTFSKDVNPAFEFCDADFFLAYRDGKIVGRIAAIVNPRANESWNKKAGRFGWIDFIDDEEVSAALLKTAEDWVRERGMEEIEGPLGFTDFDTEGMLVEGFQEIGTMITFYNHPYYMQHLEKLGYGKKADWVERRINVPAQVPEKIERFKKIIGERNGLHVAKYTKKEIRNLGIGYKIFNLINDTYKVLYGYSKLSDRQVDLYVKTYIPLVNLDFVAFIEDEKGELVAFGLMLPSMSHALQKCNGKIFPLGWYYLLRALKGHTDTLDMFLIAVRPDLQAKGVPAMLIGDILPRIIAGGFKYVETNPELEDNFAVQNLWSGFDARQHRRRRIYGRSL